MALQPSLDVEHLSCLTHYQVKSFLVSYNETSSTPKGCTIYLYGSSKYQYLYWGTGIMSCKLFTINRSTLVKLFVVINLPWLAVSATAGSLVSIIT